MSTTPAATASGKEKEDEKFSGNSGEVELEKDVGAHPASQSPLERNAGSAPEQLSTKADVQPRDPRRDVEPD